MTLWLSFGSYELGLVLPPVCVSHPSPATYWIWHPCRLGTEMVALVRVIRLVHILLPVHYTPRVALYIHVCATSIAWMVWHCGWASAHMSSDWCYPLCALVTLVLRVIGFYNPCRLGTEMVALVRVIRLVHMLLPVPYTPRVARVR